MNVKESYFRYFAALLMFGMNGIVASYIALWDHHTHNEESLQVYAYTVNIVWFSLLAFLGIDHKAIDY
jgi:hypothetical protein